MRKKNISFFLLGAFLLCLGTAIAGKDIPEVINFQGDPDGGGSEEIHPSAYTGQVVFLHTKHAQEYSEGCGTCHHDGDMEPIEAYDPDESYTCIDCHDEEGLIRGPIAENDISEGDWIANRANVIHILCINCHKKHNDRKHAISAPEACRMCHSQSPPDNTLQ